MEIKFIYTYFDSRKRNKPMKTTLNGHDYDLVIIDGDIVAQSLDHDLVFEGAYDSMVMIAEEEYRKIKYQASCDYTEKDWISDCTDEKSIAEYCKHNLKSAIKVTYNLN